MTITQMLNEDLEVRFIPIIDQVTPNIRNNFIRIVISSMINESLTYTVSIPKEEWRLYKNKLLDDCYKGFRENFPIRNLIKL